ncbi:MAG: SMC-Scp complex subunit ScpB [Polyangiaceae bacterium]|nr:SMC-Scp complex subunit ScpB [Polyangiaceae bacterium]
MTKRKKAKANTKPASFDDLVSNLDARTEASSEHEDSASPDPPQESDEETAEPSPAPVVAEVDDSTESAAEDKEDEEPALAESESISQRAHLRGLLEALIFASDAPITPKDLAKLASAPVSRVREIVGELRQDYSTRGIHLDEVAGGLVFRTNVQYASFIRDLTADKPVRLSRAQVETLAIIAYRQPITRPEIDDVRGVDSGPVLKVLLERDLVRILGKRDEPGRPMIYGTTNTFLEFFGLKSLKDLPTLREFTELTDESRQSYEDELGEPPNEGALLVEDEADASQEEGEGEGASAPRNESVASPPDVERIEEPIESIDENELDRLGREALEELEDDTPSDDDRE